MSPQCPICLKRVGFRQGTEEMHKHVRSSPRKGGRRCKGSGRTIEQAKAIKSGQADEAGTRPEDIF